MKISVNSRKVNLRPSFVERTEKKLSKLSKFFKDDDVCNVTVSAVGNLQRVEAMIRSNGMLYRAEVEEHDAFDALDRVEDILIRQIRKHKTKLEKRLRSDAFIHEQPVEETDYSILRTKTFPVKPMQLDEAILQMNMLGHQFFMFRNMDTDLINVVYHRRNGGYGLLEPEA